uniref:Uncharacterized protein n=1 Tax=Sphaerodactylus townsendi TaxID=933632 RepID=A0ACB8ET34_9SAUR
MRQSHGGLLLVKDVAPPISLAEGFQHSGPGMEFRGAAQHLCGRGTLGAGTQQQFDEKSRQQHPISSSGCGFLSGSEWYRLHGFHFPAISSRKCIDISRCVRGHYRKRGAQTKAIFMAVSVLSEVTQFFDFE